jgi:hypothetical protein
MKILLEEDEGIAAILELAEQLGLEDSALPQSDDPDGQWTPRQADEAESMALEYITDKGYSVFRIEPA